MTKRNRMTWTAAGRKASSPPATPGYGTEDQEHPAHQPDPNMDAYETGDPDSWAETPKAPPYAEGNPPALPGYDTEDQDHPAHEPNPRVPKEASLRQLVEKKAAKCARIAQAMLGKKATEQLIEDQSLAFMDLPDAEIDATLARLSGGFVMSEEEMPPMAEDFEEDLLVEEAPMTSMASGNDMSAVMSMLQKMNEEIQGLKAGKFANQNDPKGPTLAPAAKSEEQVKSEAEATAKGEAKKAAVEDPAMAAMFDAYDLDKDGFVTKADWKGPRRLFAALDRDNDGILARHEVVIASDEDEDDLDEEEEEMLAEMEKEEKKKASAQKAKKAEDEKSEDEAPKAAKKAKKAEDEKSEDEEPKAAKKAEDESEKDESEDEEPKAAKKAEDESEKDESEDEEPKASKKTAEDEESEEDETKKEACGEDMDSMFATGDDLMGLMGDSDIQEGDEALLAEIFGKKAAEETEEEEPKASSKSAKKAEESEDEESEETKEASEDEEESEEVKKEARRIQARKQASQRPQPRKPNPGIKTVGGMSRTAGSRSEIDLEKLWQTAPDVSDVFGT